MLEDFTVSKLGRVNLIVGKNNSGKSTVLEALRIYAGNASFNLLKDIAISHDEKFALANGNQKEPNLSFPYEDLFFGRQPSEHDIAEIVIGESIDGEQSLSIYRVFAMEVEGKEGGFSTELKKTWLEQDSKVHIVDQTFLTERKNRGGGYIIKLSKFDYSSEIIIVPCAFVPTQLISMDELARVWDDIVYTEREKIVTDALKIIIREFEHLVFVQNERSIPNRIAKVKLSNLPRPVPLKSLGDGMLRVLQIAIKLVSAQGGFLLIDEFENGLHYSKQKEIWALLFEMAEKLDIQVFATTHSWDCIESFSKVAFENETTEGVLFRMGRSAKTSNKGQVIATVYDKERLYNITQADIEVR
jgi:AAA15 family ATPase/GTPase